MFLLFHAQEGQEDEVRKQISKLARSSLTHKLKSTHFALGSEAIGLGIRVENQGRSTLRCAFTVEPPALHTGQLGRHGGVVVCPLKRLRAAVDGTLEREVLAGARHGVGLVLELGLVAVEGGQVLGAKGALAVHLADERAVVVVDALLQLGLASEAELDRVEGLALADGAELAHGLDVVPAVVGPEPGLAREAGEADLGRDPGEVVDLAPVAAGGGGAVVVVLLAGRRGAAAVALAVLRRRMMRRRATVALAIGRGTTIALTGRWRAVLAVVWSRRLRRRSAVLPMAVAVVASGRWSVTARRRTAVFITTIAVVARWGAVAVLALVTWRRPLRRSVVVAAAVTVLLVMLLRRRVVVETIPQGAQEAHVCDSGEARCGVSLKVCVFSGRGVLLALK